MRFFKLRKVSKYYVDWHIGEWSVELGCILLSLHIPVSGVEDEEDSQET